MQIITPPHNKAAKKVEIIDNKIPREVFEEARTLLKKTKNNEFFFPGSKHTECFAMAQPQITKKALRYFVVNPKFEKVVENLEGHIIINPRLLSKNRETRQMIKEGCMSFPYRPMKKTKRFMEIEVEYYILADETGKSGLKVVKIQKTIKDLTAIICQHELQHLNGKNIYSK